MKKEVRYTYLGTNGIIESPVHLENIYHIRKVRLTADKGKRLTKDGINFSFIVTVPEDEAELWFEVESK